MSVELHALEPLDTHYISEPGPLLLNTKRNACSFLQYATQRALLKKSGGCWGVNNGKWQQNQDIYTTVTSFNDKLYTFRDVFSHTQTAHMKVYMFLSQNTPKTPLFTQNTQK